MKKEGLKKEAERLIFGALVSVSLFGTVMIHASGADTELSAEYVQYCREAGQAYHICPEFLEAVIEQESGGDPDAVGKDGEIGLMQVYPEYHLDRMERLGMHNLFDPRENIFVAADYLSELFFEYGDAGTALMAYNGTGDVAERGGRGDYTGYAVEVMERARQLERMHGK